MKYRELFEEKSKEEQERYLYLIPILSKRLNQIHNRNENDIFWEKALGVSILIHVSQCMQVFHSKKIYYQKKIKNISIPIDEMDYRKIYVNKKKGDNYLKSLKNNLILESKFSVLKKSLPVPTSRLTKFFVLFKKHGLVRILNEILIIFLKKFIKPSLLLNQIYWDVKSKHRIQNNSFLSIQADFITIPNPSNLSIDHKIRGIISDVQGIEGKFDQFFIKSLKFALPLTVLELFSSRISFVENYFLRNNSIKHYVNESHSEDSNLMLAVASEKQISTHYIEHNFLQYHFLGNNLWFLRRKYDFFLSMGWDSSHHDNHIPLSSNYQWTIKSSKKKSIEILYISALAQYRFPHFSSAYGEAGNRNALLYLSMKKLFFEGLNKKLINKIYYRDYPENIKKKLPEHNLNLEFKDYIMSKGIFIDGSQNRTAEYLISLSKLVICDYLSTPYNSMLIANIPSIILFNDRSYLLLDEFKEIYKELLEANIMFTNSTLAAKFVNQNYRDLNKWWLSDQVQKARKRYIKIHFGPDGKLTNHLLDLTKNKRINLLINQ